MHSVTRENQAGCAAVNNSGKTLQRNQEALMSSEHMLLSLLLFCCHLHVGLRELQQLFGIMQAVTELERAHTHLHTESMCCEK